jgi:hypothetical protein
VWAWQEYDRGADEMIDIERLKTDRDYWDEVAPEGAEYCTVAHRGQYKWYKSAEPLFFWKECDSYWHETVLTDIGDLDYKDLIKRPKPTQWRGQQDGLPPVGTECEVNRLHSGGWKRCTVKLYDDHDVVCRGFDSGQLFSAMTPTVEFRPLQTERDKAIEAAVDVIRNSYGENIIQDFITDNDRRLMGALYDAGMLRQKRESMSESEAICEIEDILELNDGGYEVMARAIYHAIKSGEVVL